MASRSAHSCSATGRMAHSRGCRTGRRRSSSPPNAPPGSTTSGCTTSATSWRPRCSLRVSHVTVSQRLSHAWVSTTSNAIIPNMPEQLPRLAALAEPEDWNYCHTPSEHPYPILFNYLHHTFDGSMRRAPGRAGGSIFPPTLLCNARINGVP
jgi:Domain of unknown function (DUF3825)